jgi:hypothetical protein
MLYKYNERKPRDMKEEEPDPLDEEDGELPKIAV